MRTKCLFVLSLIALLSCSGTAEKLPDFNLETTITTVSGLSSGGYMAHQYHIAYSEQVVGAALLASGPYGCAESDLRTALKNCMNNHLNLDVEQLESKLLESEKSGKISRLSNLKNDKVWVFHGTKDSTVSEKVTSAQVKLYQKFDVNPKFEFEIPAGHGFPTVNTGIECHLTKEPFINSCGVDAVGLFFNYLYSNLLPSTQVKGKIIKFNQRKYLSKGEENTLADFGYLFAPEKCIKGDSCRVHIAFHGCNQNVESIGDRFIEGLGYNSLAEANNIVIVYPQTKATYSPLNPKGCWDWWGYSGSDYQDRKGKQLQHVNNIVLGL